MLESQDINITIIKRTVYVSLAAYLGLGFGFGIFLLTQGDQYGRKPLMAIIEGFNPFYILAVAIFCWSHVVSVFLLLIILIASLIFILKTSWPSWTVFSIAIMCSIFGFVTVGEVLHDLAAFISTLTPTLAN